MTHTMSVSFPCTLIDHATHRREVEFTLAALNRLAESGEIDPIEQEDFYNFLDAFQTFALQI